MHKRILLFLAMLLFNVSSIWAARLQGTVSDEQGKPLPYATVIVLNTNIGTSADEFGYYFLDLAYGDYEVQAHQMGYVTSSQKVTIKSNQTTLDFKMKTSHVTIKQVEIAVDYEDPGFEIMRLANERKRQRVQNIKSFESDVYIKGRLDFLKTPSTFMGVELKDAYGSLGLDEDGSGIVYALEQKSKYKYDEKRSHHYIEYVRESGNSQGLGFADLPPVLDIYENRINVLDLNPRGFISPLHNQATTYYKFEYMGEIVDAGQTVFKVKLIPRRSFEPVFKGYVYVFDKTYDIHSVELELDHTTEINIAEKVGVDQMFRYIDDQRVIQRQNLFIQLDVLGFKVGGNFITMYSQQKINHPIQWEEFDIKTIATYDVDFSSKQTNEDWEEMRPIRMSPKEVEFFEQRDSLMTAVDESNSVKTSQGLDLGIVDILVGGKVYDSDQWSMKFNGILSTLNFNTVEGLNVNLKLESNIKLDTLNHLKLGINNRYGFVNTHYNPNIFALWNKNSAKNTSRRFSLGLSGGRDVESYNEQGFLPEIFNTFTSLVQGVNHLKLVRKDFIEVKTSHRTGTGWFTNLSLGYQNYHELSNRTLYSFKDNPDLNYTSNLPAAFANQPFVDNSLLFKAGVSYQPGWKYISFSEYKRPVSSEYPTMSLGYKKAIPISNIAAAHYDLLDFSVQQDVSLKMFGSLSYVGTVHHYLSSNNKVPWSEWQHFQSNQFIIHDADINAFLMKPYYLKSHHEGTSVELHGEWKWQGFVTNKIPLFKRLKWYGVVGGHALLLDNKPYVEASFGLENIGFKLYRFIRVDGVMAWQHQQQPTYGIRLSFNNSLFN